MAGAIGLDPSGLSLRELVWMSDGKGRSDRYNIAWALSKAFGGKPEGNGKHTVKAGHRSVSPAEFIARMKG